MEQTGGTELAPMFTMTDIRVACGYAVRNGMKDGALLMKIVTDNNMLRGADVSFLSVFPGEAETAFPPLTFMQPTGKVQEIEMKGSGSDIFFTLYVVEVTTTLP